MLAKKLQKKFPSLISDVRGWGLILGIEIAPENTFGAPEVSSNSCLLCDLCVSFFGIVNRHNLFFSFLFFHFFSYTISSVQVGDRDITLFLVTHAVHRTIVVVLPLL